MAGQTLHVGILRTDSVVPELQGTFGDYPDMFERTFVEVDPQLEFTAYDVREGPPEELTCDAYLITGSRHSVYEDLPWMPALVAFLRAALADGRRVVGICFGHQFMAHYFGGKVDAAEAGWGVGVQASHIVAEYPWMASDMPATVNLLASHKDQVIELPHWSTHLPVERVLSCWRFCHARGHHRTRASRIYTGV